MVSEITKAEIGGANWATEHSEFQDYSDLKMEARIEGETRYGSDEDLVQAFTMGALVIRKDVCLRKGY